MASSLKISVDPDLQSFICSCIEIDGLPPSVDKRNTWEESDWKCQMEKGGMPKYEYRLIHVINFTLLQGKEVFRHFYCLGSL